jgi:hypothetical protein
MDNNVQCHPNGLSNVSLVDTNADSDGDQQPDGALFILSTGFVFPIGVDTTPFAEAMNSLYSSQVEMKIQNKKWSRAIKCTSPNSAKSKSNQVQLFVRDILGAFFLYALFTTFVIVASLFKYWLVKYNLDKAYFPNWKVDIMVLDDEDDEDNIRRRSKQMHQDSDSDDESDYIKSLGSFRVNPSSASSTAITNGCGVSLNEVIQDQISQEMEGMAKDLRAIKKEVSGQS